MSMSLKRRTVLTAATALPAVALAASLPLDASAKSRQSFYLSSSGDDSASGTSKSAAWRSLNRLQQAFESGEVGYGATVRFKRGEQFYGDLGNMPELKGEGRLVLKSYGRGPRPKILGYKVLDKPEAWQQVGDNLWRIDLRSKDNYSGNTLNDDTNVGFLRVDGTIHGHRLVTVDELRSDWQFHAGRTDPIGKDEQGNPIWDELKGFLTVYSAENPSTRGEVCITVKGNLIRPRSHMTIEGLELVGGGGHGVQLVDVTNVKVANNRIREIGGSYVYETTRYGNGVEMWINTKDVLVQGNTIHDVYDVGVTLQGEQILGPDEWGSPIRKGWSNVHVKHNRIYRCSQSFEIWARGYSTEEGYVYDHGPESGYRNCSFTHNCCTDAGVGWGFETRTNKDEGGVHLLSYNEDLYIDLRITHNQFLGAVNAYMYRLPIRDYRDVPADDKNKLVIDRNIIRLKPGQRLQQPRPEDIGHQRPETIEQHATWSAETGFDKRSRFIAR